MNEWMNECFTIPRHEQIHRLSGIKRLQHNRYGSTGIDPSDIEEGTVTPKETSYVGICGIGHNERFSRRQYHASIAVSVCNCIVTKEKSK